MTTPFNISHIGSLHHYWGSAPPHRASARRASPLNLASLVNHWGSAPLHPGLPSRTIANGERLVRDELLLFPFGIRSLIIGARRPLTGSSPASLPAQPRFAQLLGLSAPSIQACPRGPSPTASAWSAIASCSFFGRLQLLGAHRHCPYGQCRRLAVPANAFATLTGHHSGPASGFPPPPAQPHS